MNSQEVVVRFAPDELTPKAIGQALSRLSGASRELQTRGSLAVASKNYMPELIDVYEKGNVMLVLGAGASAERGLLTWSLLLQELLLETIKAGSKESADQSRVLAWAFQEVFNPNPLVAARYLKNCYERKANGDGLSFIKKVRDTLYRGLRPVPADGLLAAIRRLCMAVGKSPNLRGVITYNFDDLLEEELRERGDGVKFRAIYEPGVHAASHELPVFHVHGYLPRDVELTDSNTVVFSEELYHKQYGDVYHWSNLVQINAFAENNCLLIGTSLTDPNQRRLLDIAKKLRGDDEIHHYCVRKRYTPDIVKADLEWQLKRRPELEKAKIAAKLTELEAIKHLIQITETYESEDAASFGVGLIWVNEYSEYAEVIRRVINFNRDAMPGQSVSKSGKNA